MVFYVIFTRLTASLSIVWKKMHRVHSAKLLFVLHKKFIQFWSRIKMFRVNYFLGSHRDASKKNDIESVIETSHQHCFITFSPPHDLS